MGRETITNEKRPEDSPPKKVEESKGLFGDITGLITDTVMESTNIVKEIKDTAVAGVELTKEFDAAVVDSGFKGIKGIRKIVGVEATDAEKALYKDSKKLVKGNLVENAMNESSSDSEDQSDYTKLEKKLDKESEIREF